MSFARKFERERTVGELSFTLPKPPKLKDIPNYDLPSKRQRFIPPDQKVVYRISSKIDNEDDLTQEEVEFILEENRKRKEGYWFFNNGNIEYITGLHYFYLSAWKMEVVQDVFDNEGNLIGKKKFAGLPSFTDSDRDYFYFWHQCVIDPKCTGMCHITNRRDGKTFRANVTMYEATISQPDAVGAIQSKTGADAKKVFLKIVKSWQMLPAYYKPVDTGESRPVTELRFDEPSKRNSKSQKKEYSKVLRSVIAWHASAEEQLDGMAVTLGLMDEFGKYRSQNAAEMYRINRECVSDGTFVSGKYLLTSTVEDMDKKGGKHAKEIWDGADPNDKNDLGMTPTGLYRYFKPAYRGLRGEDQNGVPFIDEYGYSDEERTKEYLLKKRKNLSGAALSSERRKYPLNVRDCFVTDGSEEVFSAAKLEEQQWHNDTLKGMVRTGNFFWKNSDRTEVGFLDDPNGRFSVSWFPPLEKQNHIIKKGNKYTPLNTDIFGAGCDPYDHKIKKDGRKLSDAAFYIFRGFDAREPLHSNTFVCEYVNRRENPDDFYEEVLMACIFYGTKVLIENQKPGLINYMNREGYGGYVQKTRKSDITQTNSRTWEDGISMAGNMVRNQMVNKLIKHVFLFTGVITEETQVGELGISQPSDGVYGTMYFDKLINDLGSFDPNKWTDHDSVVGAGLAMMSWDPVKRKKHTETKGTSIDGLFRSFKI